jgi:dihydroxyacetone kinase
MPDGECEVGLGLHNEAGVSRRKMDGVQSVIQEMIEMIMNSKTDSSLIRSEDDLVLFVNNLGGVSQLEMGALLSDLVDELGSSYFFLDSPNGTLKLEIQINEIGA